MSSCTTKMAAPCTYVTRSASRVFCQLLSRQWILTTGQLSTPSCLNLYESSHRRRLHCSQTPAFANINVESQKEGFSNKATGEKKTESKTKAEEEEEEEDDGPEYIPKRKAKNPMLKIGYAWMIGLPTGIIGFILAKREVDKNRLKQLRIRQRMKRANEGGEYESSRYRNVSSGVE